MWNFETEEASADRTQSTYPAPPAIYIQQVNDQLAAGIIPQPPKPPSGDQSYSMFGETYQESNPVIPVLVDPEGYRVEFDEAESKKDQMKDVNKNILYQFLDLLKKLESGQPTQELLDTIQMEFVKLIHLTNEYLPFMHRFDLIEMLEKQKATTLEEVEKLTDVVKKTVRSLRFYVFPKGLRDDEDLATAKACEPKEDLPTAKAGEPEEDLVTAKAGEPEEDWATAKACEPEANCMFCAAYDIQKSRQSSSSE